MVDIRTNCPTKLCYLQKCSVSPYQFILRISINICRVESASVHPPVYILRDICSVCLRIQDFRDQRQAPLTQTPSTPKHTNPIQQSSRNRKAVIPSRQKNPTKTKTLPAFFFFSSLLLSKRHPHQCCVSLLHTARHTTLSPVPDSGQVTPPGYYLANEKFGGIFNPPSNPLLSS